MTDRSLKLFALQETRALGLAISAALGQPLAQHEERVFEDGEVKLRSLESVRDADVFLIQSLHGNPWLAGDSGSLGSGIGVHDKLCRLLLMIGALRDAGAGRITAVLPYLCYARKDRRTKSRDPLSLRYIAQLIEAMGVDRVMLLDPHNPAAVENAFRCPSIQLSALPLFADRLGPSLKGRRLVVVSPDSGGAKRAETFRRLLAERTGQEIGSAFIEKYRSGGRVWGGLAVGELAVDTAILVDDMISTGGTLLRAARSCRDAGARHVLALVTHGLFSQDAPLLLSDPALDALWISDSIQSQPDPLGTASEALRGKLQVLSIAPLLAEAIAERHSSGYPIWHPGHLQAPAAA